MSISHTAPRARRPANAPKGVHPTRTVLNQALCVSFSVLGAGMVAPASASVFSWTGGASDQWSNAANWVGGAPVSGTDTQLLFDSPIRPTSFNDIAAGLALNRLTLGANAGVMSLSGQALNFQGSGATISSLTTAGHALVANAMVFSTDVTVAGGPSFSAQLFLQGATSGAGAMTLASGVAVIYGNNSRTGATTVANGATLGVAGNGLAGSSGVNIQTGGELQILRPNSTTATTLSIPIQLAGMLSTSAKRIGDVLGQSIASAYVSGPIRLTGDGTLRALGGTGTGLNSVALSVGGTVDRAGSTLTLSNAGANNSISTGAIGGNGGLVLKPNGDVLTLGDVSGDGNISALGAPGTVTMRAVSGNGRFDVAYDSDTFGRVNVNGVMSGLRDVSVANGTLLLGNVAHSFTGTLVAKSGGTLSVNNQALLGNAANTIRFEGGGALELTGKNADAVGNLTRAIHTTGGMGSIGVGAGLVRHIRSNITGDGGISLYNFGLGSIAALSGNNTFAGGLAIGTNVNVTFANDDNLGAAGGLITLAGALTLPDTYTLARDLVVSGNNAIVGGGGQSYLISSNISGTGRLNLSGASTFTLTGNNTQTGGVAMAGDHLNGPAVLNLDTDARLGAAGGVLNLGRQNGFFVLPGALRATANLSIDASRSTTFRGMTVDTNGFDITFNQAISGRDMTKTGLGTWVLNTANTDSSNTNQVQIDQGIVQLGINEAFGSRATVNVNPGGVLNLAGYQLTTNSITVAEGGLLNLGSQGTGTLRMHGGLFSGGIEGVGHLVVGREGFSPGSANFNAANTFTGSVTVQNDSTLYIGHSQALGNPTNTLTLNNGILSTLYSLAAPLVISASTPLNIGAGGAGFAAGGQSLIIERQLTGSAPLNFYRGNSVGEGSTYDVRLAHRANTFVGNLQLGDAVKWGDTIVGITADGSLGAASNQVMLGGRFYDGESDRTARGGLRAWDNLSLAASRVVKLEGDGGWIDTNGYTFAVQGAIGELSSRMDLLKTGTGTLVLNGINTYTGVTQVLEGALGGHGSVAHVEISDGATLTPGESAGLLTITGNLIFNGGQLNIELGGLQRGIGFDALNVGGYMDLGSTALLNLGFINGFGTQVLAGNSFDILLAGTTVYGQFANVASGQRLLTADGLGSFEVRYGNLGDLGGTQQGLVLSNYAVAAVPEPESWAMLLAGLGLMGAVVRKRRKQVQGTR